MKCPQCGAENILMQSHPGKSFPMVGFVLAFGGLGMMFFGILGAIVGILPGLLVGAIVKACVPPQYETVGICQSCGFTAPPADLQAVQKSVAPNVQDNTPCNLSIARRSSATGSLINLCVKIDDRPPLILSDGGFRSVELEEGEHLIIYEQQNGFGKANRRGSIMISVEPEVSYSLSFMFTPNGLDVSKSW